MSRQTLRLKWNLKLNGLLINVNFNLNKYES